VKVKVFADKASLAQAAAEQAAKAIRSAIAQRDRARIIAIMRARSRWAIALRMALAACSAAAWASEALSAKTLTFTFVSCSQ